MRAASLAGAEIVPHIDSAKTGPSPIRMGIIDGAQLLGALGLHEREAAGLIDYRLLYGARPTDPKSRDVGNHAT